MSQLREAARIALDALLKWDGHYPKNDYNADAVEALTAALALPDAQPATTEQLVRYCPGCGSVGPVGEKFLNCCPDGNEARLIPKPLAEKCHDTFKLAINAICASPQPVIAPTNAEGESYARMFNAACVDLGLISEALGLDPDDGGAEPILAAIEDLKSLQPAIAPELLEAAIELLAAADNSLSSAAGDDIAAMLRFGAAEKALRAAIAKAAP